MKKYMLVTGFLVSCMILSACNKQAGNNEDELLAAPEYQTQELTQAVSNKVGEYEYEIVEGYEIIPVNWAGDIVKFAIPYVENRVRGVYYHNDDIYELAGKGAVSYSGANCPDGASYIKQPAINNSGFWSFSTLPRFGYNQGLEETFEEGEKIPELHMARELLNTYVEKDEDADKMYSTPVKMGKCTLDVQCITVALYEDFYEKKPDLTLKVYGVTNSVWEKYLGREMKFSVMQKEQFMKALEDSNYNECVLLGEREIAETGVYYIDIKELSERGGFVQYILTADFSEAMEYSYRINYYDTYEIKAKEADLYAAWKEQHKEQFIAGGEN